MAAVLRNRVPAHARHYGSRRRVRRSRKAHKRIPGVCEFEVMSVAAISEARAASRPPRSFCSFFRQAEELGVPLGFAAIAMRILWKASEQWWQRVIAIVLTAVGVGLAALIPGTSHLFLWGSLLALSLASLLGVPAFMTLGGAALILFRTVD